MNRLIQVIVGTLLLGWSSAVSSFTLITNSGKPAQWPSHSTSYRFNTTTSGFFNGGLDASGTASDEFEPIRDAFATWLNLPGIDLTISEAASTATSASSSDRLNTIQWVKTSWRNLSFRPPSQALAVTLLSFDSGSGAIVDADIYFNADNFNWAVVDSGSESNYIDVQNIATHEIGHFIGLDHSSEDPYEDDPTLSSATMYYASSSAEVARRDLNSDDEVAMRAIYGTASRGTAVVSGAELISSVSKILTYRITGSGFNEYTSFALSKNSNSEIDVLARYRTISSSTEATAQFDAQDWTGGSATIIGFNSPSQLSRFSVELDTSILGATSAGGGGGCSIRADGSTNIFYSIILLFVSFAVLSLRRKLSLVPHKNRIAPKKH